MNKSSENKIYRAIGLMSGTAMDGIDAALIETDGYHLIRPIGFVTRAHDPALRHHLLAQMNTQDYDRGVERDFTLAQIPVIESLLNQDGLSNDEIDIIGFHGQTTHHDPQGGVTVQMGDGGLLAAQTGIDVVYDFRTQDMKNGGQGAPLIPIYHQALVKNAALSLPVVILNLGGVGNITYLDDEAMIAFDTGPGNALIDDWIRAHTDHPYDKGGQIAAKGTVDTDKISAFLSHPYFEKAYPKSLDRNDFAGVSRPVNGMTVNDGAATLTDMTVHAVHNAITLCPNPPRAIYVTGGGRLNDFMMRRLHAVTDIPIHKVDDLGWHGDAMEAEGFAYMAVRSILNEPISFPTTTGCHTPTQGGVFASAER